MNGVAYVSATSPASMDKSVLIEIVVFSTILMISIIDIMYIVANGSYVHIYDVIIC